MCTSLHFFFTVFSDCLFQINALYYNNLYSANILMYWFMHVLVWIHYTNSTGIEEMPGVYTTQRV